MLSVHVWTRSAPIIGGIIKLLNIYFNSNVWAASIRWPWLTHSAAVEKKTAWLIYLSLKCSPFLQTFTAAPCSDAKSESDPNKLVIFALCRQLSIACSEVTVFSETLNWVETKYSNVILNVCCLFLWVEVIFNTQFYLIGQSNVTSQLDRVALWLTCQWSRQPRLGILMTLLIQNLANHLDHFIN